MDWTKEKAEQAEATLKAWHKLARETVGHSRVDPEIVKALSDDLNTSAALSRLHEIAKEGNAELLKSSAQFLGLFDDSKMVVNGKIPDENPLDGILKQRIEARAARDFRKSDQIRDLLKSFGIAISDRPDGSCSAEIEGRFMYDYFNSLTFAERKEFLGTIDGGLYFAPSHEILTSAYLRRIAKLVEEAIK